MNLEPGPIKVNIFYSNSNKWLSLDLFSGIRLAIGVNKRMRIAVYQLTCAANRQITNLTWVCVCVSVRICTYRQYPFLPLWKLTGILTSLRFGPSTSCHTNIDSFFFWLVISPLASKQSTSKGWKLLSKIAIPIPRLHLILSPPICCNITCTNLGSVAVIKIHSVIFLIINLLNIQFILMHTPKTHTQATQKKLHA